MLAYVLSTNEDAKVSKERIYVIRSMEISLSTI